jgi:uncharacterized protein (DUF342 family)
VDETNTAAATGESREFTPAAVVALIEQAGHGELFALDDAIAAAARKLAEGAALEPVVIARRRDARCAVVIAADGLSASLTTQRAYGGHPLGREAVELVLDEAGVVAGRLPEALDQALAAPAVADLVVARARAPVPGQDGRFERCETQLPRRAEAVAEARVVDYRELGAIRSVPIGAPLIRRIPERPAVDGMDVRGASIPAPPVAQACFRADLEGVEIAADDPDLLVAAIAGQPVFFPDGASVEPVLRLPTVDIASGNVHFQGTVLIAGDVAPGMLVQASGDVEVGGMVEAARIEVGGSVVVAGGVIGRGDIPDHVAEPPSGIATVRCGRDLTARFVENAWVEALNVTVGDSLAHSRIRAEDTVVVGAVRPKRGFIMGGLTHAGRCVRAVVVGSPSMPETRVHVGTEEDLDALVRGLDARSAKIREGYERARRLAQELCNRPAAVREKVGPKLERTLEGMRGELEALTERRRRALRQRALMDDVGIEIRHCVHPRVTLGLNLLELEVQDPVSPGTVTVAAGRIVFDHPAPAVAQARSA